MDDDKQASNTDVHTAPISDATTTMSEDKADELHSGADDNNRESHKVTDILKSDSDAAVNEEKINTPNNTDSIDVESATNTGYTTPYTTENFKIRIDNIHHRSAHSEIKQKLVALQLKPKKIKKMGGCKWAFVTFGNEEERQKALDVLEGVRWRGNTLSVKKAEAAVDPILQRKRHAEESENVEAKQPNLSLTLDDYKTQLLEKTCPLYKLSYSKQLETKQEKMRKVMQRLKDQMMRAYRDSNFPKSEYPNTEFDKLLLPIKPSPSTEGYRNKCEFTVGKHPVSKDTAVGYRLGEYRAGTVAVLEATDLPNTSQSMKEIALNFRTYVTKSAYTPFDPVSQQGHWMWLLVRTTTLGDVMVMPTFVQQNLSQEELSAVKEDIRQHYAEGDGKECGVTSLYINITPAQKKSEDSTIPPVHLSGKLTIEEKLLDLKFMISPTAFFQVNKEGAEVLYSTIGEFAGLSNKTSTVFDVCCGTGTIGMLLASHAKTVVGIEMVKQAVEDANKNAKLNNVENISFQCGKAEDLLQGKLVELDSEEQVAIVDPPRAGLHSDVVGALRKSSSLTKLVYVSCEPQSALKNFVELMRPQSKRWKGVPFRLIKAMPVDMFPYSQQCELVLLFERDTS